MRFRPRLFELHPAPDVGALLAALRDRPGLVALDSAGGTPARWSIVAFDPLEPFSIEGPTGDPLDARALAERVRALAREPGAERVPGPFQGGLIGALAYDAGAAGERSVAVAPEPWGLPLAFGGLYVDFAVRDEEAGRAWLVLGDEPGDGRPPVARRAARLRALLQRPARVPGSRPAGALPAGLRPAGPWVRHVSAARHCRRVEELRSRIARGDLYQANLAHRFTRRVHGAPLDLYLRLREVNPAPYMAYLEPAVGPRLALLSASPELLVEVQGGLARTRPIKGTIARPRDPRRDPSADRAAAERLLASDKDRAELAMIVDLARNDLGRVARPGGVRVPRFPVLQTLPALHHLVADVEAELRPGAGAGDVLAALFPGGSITGAPKLAAMRAIAELEGEGRGFFTGSAGFFGLDGNAAWNILIRTLVWRPLAQGAGEVSFRVGGGITFASEAVLEERETLVKADRLLAALEVPAEAVP